MLLRTCFLIALVEIFATTVTAQSEEWNSAVFAFDLIGVSTIDPAIQKTVDELKNATLNGTEAVQKAIANAADENLKDEDLSQSGIVNFLQAAQKNLNSQTRRAPLTLGNGKANIGTQLAQLQKFTENNKEQVQRRIRFSIRICFRAFCIRIGK